MEFESNKKFETFCRKVVGGIRHYFDKQRSGELVIERERIALYSILSPFPESFRDTDGRRARIGPVSSHQQCGHGYAMVLGTWYRGERAVILAGHLCLSTQH